MKRQQNHYQQIFDLVRQIPLGKVATYGQIAKIIGSCSPRNVGYAMASVTPEDEVPWHRVVNAQGKISLRSDGLPSNDQRLILEREGVLFHHGRIDLNQFGWEGCNMY